MVEMLSPLGAAYRSGSHGNFAGGTGVALSEQAYGSIVEAVCWPGCDRDLFDAIRVATGLTLPKDAGGGTVDGTRSAFGTGPGKVLLRDEAAGLAAALRSAMPIGLGTVTDLSHGRCAFRIKGPKAEWVLAKLYAIDFSLSAFPINAGKATAHHDIATQIQRICDDEFDLFVFRSFARSFWLALGHAADEVGYLVR